MTLATLNGNLLDPKKFLWLIFQYFNMNQLLELKKFLWKIG